MLHWSTQSGWWEKMCIIISHFSHTYIIFAAYTKVYIYFTPLAARWEMFCVSGEAALTLTRRGVCQYPLWEMFSCSWQSVEYVPQFVCLFIPSLLMRSALRSCERDFMRSDTAKWRASGQRLFWEFTSVCVCVRSSAFFACLWHAYVLVYLHAHVGHGDIITYRVRDLGSFVSHSSFPLCLVN